MTDKQKLFVTEYIKDRNATKAAIAAGYSEKTAGQAASRLLKDVKIREAVNKPFENRINKNIADAAEIREFFTSTMRNKKATNGDRIKSAELLGKTCGIFTENLDVNVNSKVVIINDITEIE